MTNQTNDYHISFFKPTTPQAKANRNMVILFFSIWAVAIFGFQFLLKAIEKPVPEDSLITFNKVWPNVSQGNATISEYQDFAQSTMLVLGKVMIAPKDRAVLDNGLSWAIMQLADSAQKEKTMAKLQEFEALKLNIEDITDKRYVEIKEELGIMASSIIGISQNDVRTKILPLELNSADASEFKPENIEKMAGIMSLYLTHNRSFLTDSVFLGFPFHYFYTAVFLLILFVGLCWLYCKKTDKLNAMFNTEE